MYLQIISSIFAVIAVTITLSEAEMFPHSGPVKRAASAKYHEWCDSHYQGKYTHACANLETCIKPKHMCDDVQHCSDGSDEVGCGKQDNAAAAYHPWCDSTYKGKYSYACADLSTCLAENHMCDKVEQCSDGSDEVGCEYENEVDTGNSGNKAAKSEQCSWFPDSPYACADGSGICMREDDLCDGFKQCDDSSDEVDCGFGEIDNNGCTVPNQMGSSGEQNIMNQIVEAHNYFRCLHGVGPVTWDNTLASFASWVASDNAARGYIHHSDGNGGEYGENIVMQPLMEESQVTGYGMVKRWYDEIKDYDFNYPGFDGATGHFTQVVWKGSTEIGCGMATSPQGSFTSFWVVCNYKQPGNWEGMFEENVPRLI